MGSEESEEDIFIGVSAIKTSFSRIRSLMLCGCDSCVWF